MIRQRLARLFRGTFVALLLCAGSGLVATPAVAQALYTVAGTPVDVTAATAIQARERALAEAQQAAARKLLERLVVPAGSPLPRLSSAQVSGIVQDVEIADEKVSPTRYIASVTVRFRPEAVRRLLRDQGLRFAEREGAPILVLPVLDVRGGPILFDDRNRWLRAWADQTTEGATPIVVPLGDIGDVNALTAQQAIAGDFNRISPVARRYGATEVAVVRASPAPNGSVAVVTTMVKADGTAQIGRSTYPVTDDDYAAAARGTAQALDRNWRAEVAAAAPEAGAPGTMLATAPAVSVEEWAALRRRIAETPGVDRVEVVALAAGAGRLRILHRADPGRLAAALAALGATVDGSSEAPRPR
ncbi:MAG: DUF2066 domain-containing protein [Alphaproteobacteria bacterium]